jgi:predicted nucleic acid-binding Zn finger protein
MDLQFKKINSLLSEKSIKLHLFEPSNMKVWTVVGMDKEYWFDPDLDFCSCPGYYFNNECYHLDFFPLARSKNQVEVTTFSDDEYESFIGGLLSEL